MRTAAPVRRRSPRPRGGSQPSSRHRFSLPVEMVDERWSSLEANAALKARRASGERRRRVRREDVDSVAAAVILERWLSGEGYSKMSEDFR